MKSFQVLLYTQLLVEIAAFLGAVVFMNSYRGTIKGRKVRPTLPFVLLMMCAWMLLPDLLSMELGDPYVAGKVLGHGIGVVLAILISGFVSLVGVSLLADKRRSVPANWPWD